LLLANAINLGITIEFCVRGNEKCVNKLRDNDKMAEGVKEEKLRGVTWGTVITNKHPAILI
jgi:hypothetical protein